MERRSRDSDGDDVRMGGADEEGVWERKAWCDYQLPGDYKSSSALIYYRSAVDGVKDVVCGRGVLLCVPMGGFTFLCCLLRLRESAKLLVASVLNSVALGGKNPLPGDTGSM